MSFPKFAVPTWPPQWTEIFDATDRCLKSGRWGQYRSETQARLTSRLAKLVDVSSDHLRLCCSGTAAIECSLRAAGVGPGDEVVVAAFDYPGNVRCIEMVGAKPVLVDVNPDDPCMNIDSVAAAAGDRVKAVIASHLFGHAFDVSRIGKLCRERNWVLIEDACQVKGMKIAGARAGSFGDFATFSFGGSKVITAGAGGAIVARSARHAAKLASILDRPSETFPMSPLQCAVIEPQLDRLQEMHAIRNDCASYLVSELRDRTPSWQWLPSPLGADSAYYKLAVLAASAQQRARIVTLADQHGFLLGAGFRSLHRASERRCRKPVELKFSAMLGDRLFLIDQRLLLCEPEVRSQYVDVLMHIYHECMES
ncbi:L-glutamine:2-deoxy-scyllo-inosose aminotransferase [Rubripirellula amarantea]|uniref:L-glutamine:2-deoxy-scyllo-inosose aminotransferase n=1 Tax=Rubripirellula amarantea TaxID=2527999 RepID=A0A5C5WGM5_9BACT|nr:aminotransferase class V-fold PLP-dependent enzyme [Rubripirellula amarantea]TWT49255.1 L-glutamine:2-deoxy-scyllo-inosose aminotransferase [Rubripirellula amarantea]